LEEENEVIKLFSKKSSDKGNPGAIDQTVSCFKNGLNCTQAVLTVYGPQFGMDREIALKVGGAFGSGMGMGETCGAVTGALMVIGLKHTKVNGVRFISKEATYDLAGEFITRFKERNRSVVCRELLECDVSTREGLREAQKEKHFKKRCPKYVRDAAEILEEILKK
jgi:C_GCAxxG_C_C family probable redox protein